MNPNQPDTICLYIDGMDCPGCAAKIERELAKSRTIQKIQVDYLSKRLFATGLALSSAEVEQKVAELGYRAKRREVESVAVEIADSNHSATLQLGGAIIAMLVAGGLRFAHQPEWAVISFVAAALILAGREMASLGLRAALSFRLDMNFLMLVAAVGAAALGEWIEAGTIVVLFAISELLEDLSVNRSIKASRALMELTPRTAWVHQRGEFYEIPARDVQRGDLVLVRPGEMIPVDGKVESGGSNVDQASLTGESMPLVKTVGDDVMAGSINGSGSLQIRVEHSPGETILDRIVALVDEAQRAKTPLQNSLETFAAYYTPIVVLSAALLATIPPLAFDASWSVWIYRSLTLLMIACPCALILAAPVTLVSAMAAASRAGVLVKGGRFLEALARVNVFAFDKTGTVTVGKPVVEQVIALDGLPPKELIRLAASVETHSEHPVAKAIIDYARKEGVELDSPQEFLAIAGRGVSGVIQARKIIVGNHALFEENRACNSRIHQQLTDLEEGGRTVMLVGTEQQLLGLIAVADQIKPDSIQAVSAIRTTFGVHTVLLTGDNRLNAERVGRELSIDDVRSELLPQQKIDAIKELKSQHGLIAMVGDGVNDAPALAAADIGIGIGGIGADVAVETSQIVLMSGSLRKLAWGIELARSAKATIAANIVLAIVVKAAFLVLAATGKATLWMALFADTGVALLVVANGLRMLKAKPA